MGASAPRTASTVPAPDLASRPAARAAARSRLRQLRLERGWTQADVAERLGLVAWTHHREQAAVNADMVAKWERGAKGISPRYRKLLAALFHVPAGQLDASAGESGSPPAADSLVAMVDNAAELLNQLGPAGQVVRPQVLAALTDEILTRRSALPLLDPAPVAVASARVADVTITELDALAERYEAAHPTADPGALLTALTAQLRVIGDALLAARSAAVRHGVLRNRVRVAILAGRLAAEDLGNPMAARAYYAQASDDADELADHALTAIAGGYSAQLAIGEGQPSAALCRLRAAETLGVTDPTITSWLAAIEATAHAANGHEPAAGAALGRAHAVLSPPAPSRTVPWFADHDPARLAALTGRVQLCAGDPPGAAQQLRDAAAQLTRLGPTGRRSLLRCLLDQAEAELQAGYPDAALDTANRAADLIRHRQHPAAGRLRDFRDALARHVGAPDALGLLNDRLADGGV
jgi:transcriptional regulator with XRE-family HTH domain